MASVRWKSPARSESTGRPEMGRKADSMPMSPLHPKSNPEVRRPVASTRVPTVLLALSLGSAVLDSLSAQSAQSPSDTLIFERQEVMIPVRDGVRLQTVIYQ